MFPVTWSHGKIMHAVSDVIVNNKWIQEKLDLCLQREVHPLILKLKEFMKE